MSNETQTELGSVVSLWRYPVKSMMGEELNATEVTDRGLLGDRAYALVDSSDGKVATPRTPENGRISLTSGLPSSSRRAPARSCLRSELPCRTAP